MSTHKPRFSHALLLDGKGGARELTDEAVEQWTPADGLLWVDLNLSSKAGGKWLTEMSQINDNAIAILMAAETRPRAVSLDDGLAIIVRGINMNPGAAPYDMVAVRVWLESSRIVTTRRRKVLSIGDVRDQLLAGRGPRTSGEFLVTLSSCLAERIGAAVENVEKQVEELEEEVARGDTETARTKLGGMRRHAAAFRRHLAPQRDAIDRLAKGPGELLTQAEIFELRETGDDLTRHIEDLDLARENALVAQEELMNRVVQEQNARMYLLSIVAAIFLPLSFVTGLLGMNVAGLPGTENPNGFLLAALAMIALGLGLVSYFRWKRWI